MYPSFTLALRREGIAATPAHLVDLIGGIDEGLAPTIGDLFLLAKATYVKKPVDEEPFHRAFFFYFAGIDFQSGLSFEESVQRSVSFKRWTEDTGNLGVQSFLEAILGSGSPFVMDPELLDLAADFQTRLEEDYAQPHYDKHHNPASDPRSTLERDLFDTGGYTVADDHTADMIDFGSVSDSDLEKRLLDLFRAQREAHEGGDTWIGTKGNSAFGNSGFSRYGIRVGGEGRHGSARAVLNSARTSASSVLSVKGYEGADLQEVLQGLQLLSADGPRTDLNIYDTVREAGRRGYVDLLFDPRVVDRMHVALFIDNGGRSMNRHVPLVQKLFAKMLAQLASLDIYYFHNCIYRDVFSDAKRSRKISLGDVVSLPSETRAIIVGDASMNPNREFDKETLGRLRTAFPYSAWLNPVPPTDWPHVQSIGMVRGIFDMFPLTPAGLAEAVQYLTRK